MNEELISVNAKDFAALAGDAFQLWVKVLNAPVEHATYGAGTIVRVENRPGYSPLITVQFADDQKIWPPKSFESGKTALRLPLSLAADAREAAAAAVHRAEAEAEAARQKAEELVAMQAAAKAEAKRWAALSPEEQHRERMAKIAERHAGRLSKLGIAFRGIRSSSRLHRATHCYECHDALDNAVDVECIACGWILCECGACGCGYRESGSRPNNSSKPTPLRGAA